MSELPNGTVTFLFTDIEGSTIRWERYPEEMRLALARHDELMREGLEAQGGVIFKTVGDAFYAAFATAGAAVSAAAALQRAFHAEPWNADVGPLRIRMAVHTGEAERRGQDYFGQPLNRIARTLSAAHGGQILLSLTSAGLVRDMLPPGISLQDLGEHRLKDIQHHERIFQLVINDIHANFPPLKTLDLHPNNLPTQLTPFIGRRKDLEALGKLLQQDDVRLITLVGPGGVGKTRLGLQVAAEGADAFPGGVYFVDLVAIRDTDGVVFALAQAVGVQRVNNQTMLESVRDYLQGKILLFIDNFEQVVEAALVVYEILVGSSQLKVLVTSRAALHLEGEHEYQVEPLAVPHYKQVPDLAELLQYESIVLFIQQAKTVKPKFHLNRANARAVVEICTQLDGLPLAIELAAAHVKFLPPQSMVKRLGRRLQLLVGGERNRSARQQTLRNAIAWSYDLLDTDEKTLLCQLAIFHHGCTLEAIEAVCSTVEICERDPLDLLQSLVDKSLLRLREQDQREPRFEMLYTIREYALEQLSEADLATLGLRHAQYYLGLVEQMGPPPVGTSQKRWLTQMEAEYENIQMALDWYAEQRQIEFGLRLVEALWHFWWLRGLLQEAYKWFEKLLAVQDPAGVSLKVRARALERASSLACDQDEHAYALSLAEEVLSIGQQLNDREIMGRAYIALAAVATHQHEHQQATVFLEESLKIRQALNDTRGMASVLNNLGNVVRQKGDLDQAAGFHEKSLLLFRRMGDEMAIAAVLNNLAEVEWSREHHEQAEVLYGESLKLCHKLGYAWGIASSLTGLAGEACRQEKYELAMNMYKESLALFQKMDNTTGIIACLEGLVMIIYKQDQTKFATRLLAQAEIIGYSLENDISNQDRDTYSSMVERLRAALGEDPFEALWTIGRTPLLEQTLTKLLDRLQEEQ
jgi:predicted ATPase/class 3 adenylate cyclase